MVSPQWFLPGLKRIRGAQRGISLVTGSFNGDASYAIM